jgi:hypothetical protein
MSAARASAAKRKSDLRKAAPKRKAGRPSPRAAAAAEPAPVLQASESELVLAWFRLLARCRGAWLLHLWQSDASIDGRATVTHTETAGILADQDAPEAEAKWMRADESIRGWRAEADAIRNALDAASDSRFTHLAGIFGLTGDELDLMRLVAATAFDPALGRVCAYLQDHAGRTYVTEELASRLLGSGRGGGWAPEMNVFRWELIQRREVGVVEPHALLCDPQIRDWLLGRSTLAEGLVGAAKLIEPPREPLPEWPVDAIASWIEESLRSREGIALRVIVTAPRGGGRRTFSAAVAQKLGMPLLAIDADASDEARWPRLFLQAQRQAFLDAAVPAWIGDAGLRRPWPTYPSLFPIQFVLCEPGLQPAAAAGVVDRHVTLPVPESATRLRLWRETSAEAGRWPDDELQRLAEQHSVWPGDIERAGRLGAHTPESAAELVRESARARFGTLAQILECPFRPDDLVLPEGTHQVLDAIAFEAAERAEFWRQPEARRLFPQGRGLVALFSGPSGTGKTMAAQVIAARMGQDLCRVNIAQLVSKWVGDTPKNVEQVIRLAAENDAILFFDEADALFAKRATDVRDAQDKFANTDTAFLLQAIESYPGIAILATNLKANIDSAFLRRIRYLVDFAKPVPALQLLLWRKLVTALAGEQRATALGPVLEAFSTAAEATGAQIKYAVLAGLFAARADGQPLDVRHLLAGLDRELGKEGRALGPRDRDRILKLGEGQ